jgi:hypothetical protein
MLCYTYIAGLVIKFLLALVFTEVKKTVFVSPENVHAECLTRQIDTDIGFLSARFRRQASP